MSTDPNYSGCDEDLDCKLDESCIDKRCVKTKDAKQKFIIDTAWKGRMTDVFSNIISPYLYGNYDDLPLEERIKRYIEEDNMEELNKLLYHNFDYVIFQTLIQGNLSLLKRLFKIRGRFTTSTANRAAEKGHLETLKWIRENGGQWDENAANYAAENGHLETLKWIRENGGDWDY